MWDNPDALNRLSRLILAATVLFALWIMGRAALESLFPFRQVTVLGANHAETRDGGAAVGATARRRLLLDGSARGACRSSSACPGCARRRCAGSGRDVWSSNWREHSPAAAWNDRATLNTHGEIFPVTPWTGLPRLYAPEGMEREVARRYGEFAALVKPMDISVEQIVVSARLSWRVRLHPAASMWSWGASA